eukprot:TRINITY_DN65951_c0_g1_i1.p1 TRINITY_DN65951_c0_g1~~TRINITY_DN65951_c0_g1_i1.p1  ORF type:complete len:278 (+),score=59.65 TRINITY_DN65951_c0_g1_i1:36-836(+)
MGAGQGAKSLGCEVCQEDAPAKDDEDSMLKKTSQSDEVWAESCLADGKGAKERYRVWTDELTKDLQTALDRIFVKEPQLEACEFSLTIADPKLDGCPLIGCSAGFSKLCGYTMKEIVGRNCRFLVDPVPDELIDKQTRTRSRDFCEQVKLGNHHQVVVEALEPWMPEGKSGELFCSQTNARKDGSTFQNMFYLVAVELDDEPYILGLQTELLSDLSYKEACTKACKMLTENMGDLHKLLSNKFWYSGPMYRQDRVAEEDGMTTKLA